MVGLEDVLVDVIWILGLSGLLATISYVSWYRDSKRWNWRYTFSIPRTLIPLCLSLEIFCIGMALNGLLPKPSVPLWESIAWSLLALLFVIQIIIYGLAGRRNGWDTSMEGKR